MDLPIEPARPRDAEQILKLQYLCFQDEAARRGDWRIPPLTQTLASLLAEYETHRILVARLGEEVVGSVRGVLVDGTCHVGRLMVHPRLQGRGLGTRLMHAIEACFPTARRFAVRTGYHGGAGLRLYARLGYAEARREAASPHVQLVHLEKARPCG